MHSEKSNPPAAATVAGEMGRTEQLGEQQHSRVVIPFPTQRTTCRYCGTFKRPGERWTTVCPQCASGIAAAEHMARAAMLWWEVEP